MAVQALKARFLVVLVCAFAGTTDALRLGTNPFATLGQRAITSIYRGVAPTASPFALSQSFSPAVFSPPDRPDDARSRLTLVWHAAVETQVDELVALARSGQLGGGAIQLTVVSFGRAKNEVQLVVLGARRSLRQFLEYASTQNLAVLTAEWS